MKRMTAMMTVAVVNRKNNTVMGSVPDAYAARARIGMTPKETAETIVRMNPLRRRIETKGEKSPFCPFMLLLL
jgi:hypothetical protein